MPSQIRDLGKEIAAFATSNAGVILIGVSDAGEIIGAPELATQAGRAEMRSRVEGIVANSVKPSTTPRLDFAEVGGVIVAAIFVEHGPAPVYYAGGIPYLRQLTSARPATPDEVIERVIAWHEARLAQRPKTDELLSEVLQLVIGTLADVEDASDDDRLSGQWLDQLLSKFAESSDTAWRLSSRCSTSRPALEIQLDHLASLLDEAASINLVAARGRASLKTAISAVGAAALDIRRAWLDAELAAGSPDEVESQVDDLIRTVANLAKRADSMVSKAGGVLDLQTKAGALGWALLRAAQLGVGWGAKPVVRNFPRRRCSCAMRRSGREKWMVAHRCAPSSPT